MVVELSTGREIKDKNFNKQSKIIPILTMLLLPPIIAELLFGSTSISTLFVLIPEIGIYGCLSLLFRYIKVKKSLPLLSLALFGVAFALAEECILQQTSLEPLAGLNPDLIYGRYFGVNWIYLIWALGYETFWGILIPILLFDLIFPQYKNDPLIEKKGLIVSIIIFSFSCFLAWYSWTQIAYPLFTHGPIYYPAPILIMTSLGLIVILLLLGLSRKDFGFEKIKRKLPPLFVLGLIVFLISLCWFILVLFAYGSFSKISIVVPLLLCLLLLFSFIGILNFYSRSIYWTNSANLVVIIACILANMSAGFIVSGIYQPIDVDGKVIFNIVAIILLIELFRKTNKTSGRIKEEIA